MNELEEEQYLVSKGWIKTPKGMWKHPSKCKGCCYKWTAINFQNVIDKYIEWVKVNPLPTPHLVQQKCPECGQYK